MSKKLANKSRKVSRFEKNQKLNFSKKLIGFYSCPDLSQSFKWLALSWAETTCKSWQLNSKLRQLVSEKRKLFLTTIRNLKHLLLLIFGPICISCEIIASEEIFCTVRASILFKILTSMLDACDWSYKGPTHLMAFPPKTLGCLYTCQWPKNR